MKLTVVEGALLGAVMANEERISEAAEEGHEWRYRGRFDDCDEYGNITGEVILDDEIRVAFSRSKLEGFDYTLFVQFWDNEGLVDFFYVDLGIKTRSVKIAVNPDPEAIFSPIEDLGTVIDMMARLEQMDLDLAAEAKRRREEQAAYAERRSRFTVIDCQS